MADTDFWAYVEPVLYVSIFRNFELFSAAPDKMSVFLQLV